MSLKKDVCNSCLKMLSDKIASLQKILLDLQLSAANETKSTAGDKHETALAMLQIEQENTSRQLNVLLGQRLELSQINLSKKGTLVSKGSLIYTNRGLVFISVGLGKIFLENRICLVISNTSPLGNLLTGKQVNETIHCNGIDYRIEQIE
ncbi:MAG: hypothetical protein LH478_06690 [Chitinophagaceae bacterium]|nr:hypothetical protein [Chitinophagaceae bacterium]